jgi:hypothetical protein
MWPKPCTASLDHEIDLNYTWWRNLAVDCATSESLRTWSSLYPIDSILPWHATLMKGPCSHGPFSWRIPSSECARIGTAFHTIATRHHYARARGNHVARRFSRHSRLTWPDRIFHVENAVQRNRSCRANACRVIALLGHANRTIATKRVIWAKIFRRGYY